MMLIQFPFLLMLKETNIGCALIGKFRLISVKIQLKELKILIDFPRAISKKSIKNNYKNLKLTFFLLKFFSV